MEKFKSCNFTSTCLINYIFTGKITFTGESVFQHNFIEIIYTYPPIYIVDRFLIKRVIRIFFERKTV